VTPDRINELRRDKYNATVLRLTKVHSDLMLIRVKPDFPMPPHLPGQYTTLGLGFWEPRHPGCQDEPTLAPEEEARLGRRSYSISHPVLADDGEALAAPQNQYLEFYIVLVREASLEKPPVLTPRLFMLRQGDRLNMGEKITGHFTLAGVKPTDSVLFLSTGTGEAPHNYMTWELLRNNHQGRILAACCVRYARDLGYLKMHERLMQMHPNYTYLPMTTREGLGPGGKKYVQDLIISGELERHLGKPLDPAATHVYLCGNPSMIGVPVKDRGTGELKYPEMPGAIELLVKRGFATDQPAKKIRGNVHYEEYW
jgi:ferredoxin--NADP+ reductase